jgi:hypothetical protein
VDNEAPLTLPAAALPAGARILHIGPSKTGTTALQGACWAARADLERQGVHYAATRQHESSPARAITGVAALASDAGAPPPMRWWTWMVREMRRSSARHILYSSEFLAHADGPGARRIVDDIGPDTQVLLTLRPLDAILGSKWQQAVQAGNTLTLDEWLTRKFTEVAEDREERKAGVWLMHRHGRLVQRWAAAAGADRVTIVIADPRNHGFLFSGFEGLLGLRPGTLQPVADHQNRSLTLPEVEIFRQFNLQAAAVGMGRGARNYLVLAGAARNVKRRPPAADAPRVVLPAWATDRARELAEEAVAEIRASGVNVVGDLDLLLPAGRPAAPDAAAVDMRVDVEVAAAAAIGAAFGTGLRLGPRQPDDDLSPLPFLRSADLLRILGARLRRRVSRTGRTYGLPDD